MFKPRPIEFNLVDWGGYIKPLWIRVTILPTHTQQQLKMSYQNNINPDGHAPRVDYNLIGGGAIDYRNQTILKLFNYFSKYDNVQNSDIARIYTANLEYGGSTDFNTIKQMIIEEFNLVIQEEIQEAILLDDSIPDEEPESDSESDDEFIIPPGAEIIEVDQYEEPEIVELKKIKIEPGTENKKRKREIESEPINKVAKNYDQDLSESLDRAYFYMALRAKAKALRGVQFTVSDPLPPPVRN